MRIVAVGEGMLELARDPQGVGWRLGYGGDTLNTAIHLARLGGDVAFATALGADPFSEELCAAWQAEGVDTSLVLTDAARQPGLYAIHTGAGGERSFTYWRNDSAARRIFDLPGSAAMAARAGDAGLLVYSLITLAILPPPARVTMYELAQAVRARGGRVAFDSNYRPRLWASREEACAARDRALASCDIGLPTLEDEVALSGLADAAAVAEYWAGHGVTEVVVKLGARGCRVHGGELVPAHDVARPVDTAGAGDAFNAGYLWARLGGASPSASASAGHRLAGWVIRQHGAVPARAAGDPY